MISLIIPVYNEEKYIAECLDYILKNSDGYIDEIVLVDNNSTDKTYAIIHKYANQYPFIKLHKEIKKGPTFARQMGFTHAKGDILAFIDADCHIPPGRSKKIHDSFSGDSALGLLSGPYCFYDLPRYGFLYSWIYFCPPLAYCLYRALGYLCTGGNFAIRKSVLVKMNGFDTNIMFYGDDTDVARRAKRFAHVKYSLDFTMPTSSRRYTNQGVLSTIYHYLKNLYDVIIDRKPSTQNYNDYR